MTEDTTDDKSSRVQGFRAAFGCTHQALALYRISLGLLLTLELVTRFRYLHPFYSDEGTLPLRLLHPKIDDLYRAVSLHTHLYQLWQIQLVLAIQVVAAICFTIGYKTKIATIVSWYLYLSLTLRNTWLNFILDRYFHYLLWYAMFLPLEQCWSVSNDKQQSNNKKRDLVLTPATIALKCLVYWIYIDAGGGKYLDPLQGWTYHAQPLPALDTYTRHTTFARYVYALLGPAGLRALTPTVVYIELLAAPVALIGSYFGWAKLVKIAVGLICQLHVGIALCMNNAALLSFVACSAWCVFLPIGWDAIDNREDNEGDDNVKASGSNDDLDDETEYHDDADDTTDVPLDGSVADLDDTELEDLQNEIQQHGLERKKARRAKTIAKDATFAEHVQTTISNLSWVSLISTLLIIGMILGNIWFETISESCDQTIFYSTIFHCRWNVFVGAEEYVTWEIAPGLLADGSVVDVWGRKNEVDWRLPGTGAPCTSTARPGRWRSFPYLAELKREDGEALWSYLCRQWDHENDAANNPGRQLIKYNFFMLQADVLPNMGFSATRKRLIHSYDCVKSNDTDAPFLESSEEKSTEAFKGNDLPAATADGNTDDTNDAETSEEQMEDSRKVGEGNTAEETHGGGDHIDAEEHAGDNDEQHGGESYFSGEVAPGSEETTESGPEEGSGGEGGHDSDATKDEL